MLSVAVSCVARADAWKIEKSNPLTLEDTLIPCILRTIGLQRRGGIHLNRAVVGYQWPFDSSRTAESLVRLGPIGDCTLGYWVINIGPLGHHYVLRRVRLLTDNWRVQMRRNVQIHDNINLQIWI